MRLYLDEVAPAAPLLIPLAELLVWAVGFAFCLLAVYIARAFFGAANSAVGWIPWIGKVVSASLTSIEQKIVHFLGSAAAACDAKVGAALHTLARVVDRLGASISRHASLILQLAQLMPGVGQLVAMARQLYALLHRLHAAERAIHGIGHDVLPRVRQVERGIGADVLPRIRTLEREIAGPLEREIAGIRAREHALGRELDALRRWARRHALIAGTAAFAGAVAWALARLGAGWVRCGNVRNIGRRLCGTDPSLLEALLGDLLAIVGTVSLVELAGELLALSETFVPAVTGFFRETRDVPLRTAREQGLE